MKFVLLAIIATLTQLASFSQSLGTLCKKNEEIIFAFQLKNKKWVTVCKEKNEAYIVYRYGTNEKTELTYPKKLDSTSWQLFAFNGYSRGGGKQNAAMHYGFLTFTNNNVSYEIYDTWNSEDDKERCGVTIKVNGKTSDISGLLYTKKGSLLSLMDNEKIKIEE